MENELFDFISRYMPLLEEERQALTDFDIFRNFKKGTILLKEGQLSKDEPGLHFGAKF
jgi:hypothetical protein